MSEEKARWLARRFDLVGLSCDGPADIQNRQRPRWDGGPSAQAVERTAHILHEEGCRLHVRTTITRATLTRQPEIASYICQELDPQEIHFEPVYVGGRSTATTQLGVQQCDQFVSHFWQAREVGKRHEIPLTASGTRPGSIHGPYCHVFRPVLNLVPGGVATACFKVTKAEQAIETGTVIGALDKEMGRFELDHFRVLALRRRLDPFSQCTGCFNQYHCAQECPDRCPLDKDGPVRDTSADPGFRCRVQKALARAILQETAETLWAEAQAGKENGDHTSYASCRTLCGTTTLSPVLSVSAARD